MKTTPLNRAVQAIAASALLSFASAGWAAETWNLGTGCSSINGTTGSASSISCGSAGGVTVSAQGYSTYSTTTLSTATVYNWGSGSGLGVQKSGDTNHSTDNNNGVDLIALTFGKAVSLTEAAIGWWTSDRDITVLAYTGIGTPASISGKALGDLVAAGWTSVKNYGTSGTTTATTGDQNTDVAMALSNTVSSTNTSTVYSSWWLISAYSNSFGAGSMDSTSDYVKVLSVSGNVKPSTDTGNKVPEPGSLALIGLGLLGLLGTSRRRKAKGLAA